MTSRAWSATPSARASSPPDPGLLPGASRVLPGSPPERRRHIHFTMPPRAPFTRSPVVLIANSGTWLNQALDSMLEPLGYKVETVGSRSELQDRVTDPRLV